MWGVANPRGDINTRSWMHDWEILNADVFSRPISQYLRLLRHPVWLRLSKWKAQVFVFSLFDRKVWHQRWLSEIFLGQGLILGNFSEWRHLWGVSLAKSGGHWRNKRKCGYILLNTSKHVSLHRCWWWEDSVWCRTCGHCKGMDGRCTSARWRSFSLLKAGSVDLIFIGSLTPL